MTRMAFNPLPWFLTADGWRPEAAPPLGARLSATKSAGYDGIHAEVPEGSSAALYLETLRRHGLEPAPGYFQASFAGATADGPVAEAARRVASDHAALGLDRIFLAEQFGTSEVRLRTPAIGADGDRSVLAATADGIGVVAGVMVAEGVRPCLHQHVGTLIETEAETEAVLDAVPARLLALGPDTGHLAWAGVDPAAFIGRHSDRVGAVHIKDLRREVAGAGLSYQQAGARHLWTEPGRGDLDLDAVIRVLTGFKGWFVIEVDIADRPTVEESALVSAEWLRPRLEASAP